MFLKLDPHGVVFPNPRGDPPCPDPRGELQGEEWVSRVSQKLRHPAVLLCQERLPCGLGGQKGSSVWAWPRFPNTRRSWGGWEVQNVRSSPILHIWDTFLLLLLLAPVPGAGHTSVRCSGSPVVKLHWDSSVLRPSDTVAEQGARRWLIKQWSFGDCLAVCNGGSFSVRFQHLLPPPTGLCPQEHTPTAKVCTALPKPPRIRIFNLIFFPWQGPSQFFAQSLPRKDFLWNTFLE